MDHPARLMHAMTVTPFFFGNLPPILFPATACLAALLAFYGWLGLRVSSRAVLKTQPFGPADIVCAAILAFWMITVIHRSLHTPPVVTLSAILGNSVVYCAILLGIYGVMGFQGNSALEFFGLGMKLLPKSVLTGVIWLAVTYPLILAVQGTAQRVSGNGDDAQLIVRYFLEHTGLRQRGAVIFMAVIVAPVAEEFIFRGYFYGVIRRYGGRIPAILTSSLLFAAIHAHLPSMPGLGILAIILCLLYERTGSLWAPIAMHACFNATTIAILLTWPEVMS